MSEHEAAASEQEAAFAAAIRAALKIAPSTININGVSQSPDAAPARAEKYRIEDPPEVLLTSSNITISHLRPEMTARGQK